MRMMHLLGYGLIFAIIITGCETDVPPDDEVLGTAILPIVADNTTLTDVTLTHYTLANEASTSGQNTGNTEILCNHPNLSGCYHKEFLCSGYGVAMQGTGIGNDGKYVKYVSGGGGWMWNYQWLNNCGSAVFAHVSGVTGASGKTLIEQYSIAVDPTLIPLGWYVWIDSEQGWYRADDTGGAIKGKHLDIYMGATGAKPKAGTSKIFVTQTAHAKGDPSPFGGGTTMLTAPSGLWPSGWSTIGQATVNLTWSQVSGADGYELYVKAFSGGSWHHYWQASITQTSYNLQLLMTNTPYAFAVRAKNGNTTSPLSTWSTFKR
ncbi:MAG: fibronectin type III domain-containing protein [Myxococcales bacterium]|nr:fibronectin type III domain-containing protein [Myxococcales bacterium]